MGMSSHERKQCAKIISKTSKAGAGIAVGSVLVPIPFAATAALCCLEIAMVESLGDVFGIHVTESRAKAVMKAAGAAVVGNGIYVVGMNALSGVPLAGPLVAGVTAPYVITSLGWDVANYFAGL